jgi:vacuolar iron transporter family protein
MNRYKDARQRRLNLQDEVNSAALYRTLAELESQPHLAEVYRRLASVEERHARLWAQKLSGSEQPVALPRPGWQPRVLGWLAKRLGPQFLLPIVATMEQVDRHSYDAQTEAQTTTLSRDEQSHARLLHTIAGVSPVGIEGSALARLEGRHRAIGGNTLRAAVLGANDGLVSNLSLVMGVAGAHLASEVIVITGFAGVLAGAASMAMGEWLSVQSSRELYQRQIDIEAQELAEAPEEEQEELTLIYRAKGLPEREAHALAARLSTNGTTALETLSREELGIEPGELGGSAWVAAGISFALFTIGALLPVTPFLVFAGKTAVIASLAISTLALFVIGAGITLLTGRGVLFSGFRQVLIGLAAAGVTYGIGRLLGVAVTQ